MPTSVILSLSALLSMLPASLLPFGQAAGRERLFWLLLVPAIVGPTAWVAVQMYGRWYADLSGALWVTVAATMVLFAGLSLIVPASRRLAPLLLPLSGVAGRAGHRAAADRGRAVSGEPCRASGPRRIS
ncbi:hypothetical protein [Oceanibaculum nanhaiense]|uniref:hypothetical protein n=1 Tax=Oceanibaculum nanhaiense TaxID=1909734 RepID=UPI003D2A7C07